MFSPDLFNKFISPVQILRFFSHWYINYTTIDESEKFHWF